MSKIFENIQKVSESAGAVIKPTSFEQPDMRAYVLAVYDSPDEVWDELDEETQNWVTDQHTALSNSASANVVFPDDFGPSKSKAFLGEESSEMEPVEALTEIETVVPDEVSVKKTNNNTKSPHRPGNERRPGKIHKKEPHEYERLVHDEPKLVESDEDLPEVVEEEPEVEAAPEPTKAPKAAKKPRKSRRGDTPKAREYTPLARRPTKSSSNGAQFIMALLDETDFNRSLASEIPKRFREQGVNMKDQQTAYYTAILVLDCLKTRGIYDHPGALDLA